MSTVSEERYGDWIVVRKDGETHVAELVLDRPKAMNAVSAELAADLVEACTALAEDLDVRATVLSSSNDRAFCVGAVLPLQDGGAARHRLVPNCLHAHSR